MSSQRRKTRKRRQAHPATNQASRRWIWGALLAAGILLLGAGLALLRSPDEVPVTASGPRLSVDQEAVDYGEVKLNTPVRTVFTVANVGDAPLQILGEPEVELVEGC